MAGKNDSAGFEILVVLAIVAIVAVTGQVLIHFQDSALGYPGGSSDVLLTGFAVSGNSDSEGDEPQYADLGVERIDVGPASPLIGEPFEVRVYVKNKGTLEVSTPFYVQAEFQPRTEESTAVLGPIALQEIMPKTLAPGEETYVSFLVTTIVPEGPMRIVATADPTVKIDDANFGNNQMSKTIIVASE